MKKSKNDSFVKRISEIVKLNPCWGYRKVSNLLRKEGIKVSHKQVYEIMKEKGFLHTQPHSFSPRKIYIEMPNRDKVDNLIFYIQ
jgi:transposase